MTVTDERWLGKMALNRMVGEMAGIRDDLVAAACLGTDPELFFVSGDLAPQAQARQRREAKQVCNECPVRLACLEGALERNEPTGIWGGLSTRERHALKAQRRGIPPKPPSKHGAMTAEAARSRRDLYDRGLCDREIAAIEGVKRNTIATWRYNQRLDRHPDRQNPTPPAVDSERIQLHAEGLTDQEIADKTGATRALILRWRNRQGLPRNETRETKTSNEMRTELHAQGMTDSEIAAREGVGRDVIMRWRKRNGLPINKRG